MQLAAVGGHFIGNWVATTLWIMSQLCPHYVPIMFNLLRKVTRKYLRHLENLESTGNLDGTMASWGTTRQIMKDCQV